MVSKKKTKAQLAYERERGKLLKRRQRDVKAGVPWYDLPPSIKGGKKQKISAAEYRKATAALARYGKAVKQAVTQYKAEQKEAEKRRKEEQRIQDELAARQYIDNFLYGLDNPNFEGGPQIINAVRGAEAQAGPKDVAAALDQLNQDGNILTWQVLYDKDGATGEYLAQFRDALIEMGYKEAAGWFKDTGIEGVDQELQ